VAFGAGTLGVASFASSDSTPSPGDSAALATADLSHAPRSVADAIGTPSAESTIHAFSAEADGFALDVVRTSTSQICMVVPSASGADHATACGDPATVGARPFFVAIPAAGHDGFAAGVVTSPGATSGVLTIGGSELDITVHGGYWGVVLKPSESGSPAIDSSALLSAAVRFS
jgi:hypothetical protein